MFWRLRSWYTFGRIEDQVLEGRRIAPLLMKTDQVLKTCRRKMSAVRERNEE